MRRCLPAVVCAGLLAGASGVWISIAAAQPLVPSAPDGPSRESLEPTPPLRWVEVDRLQIAQHFAFVDDVHGLVAVGGTRGGVWSMPLTGPPVWRELWPSQGEWFSGWRSFAWNPVDRIVYFQAGGAGVFELYTIDLDTGEHGMLDAPNPPPGRSGAPLVYDAERHRLLLTGGHSAAVGVALGDVWALELGDAPAWTRLAGDGDDPGSPYRGGAGLVIDRARDRLLLFDLVSADPGVWSFGLAGAPRWTRLSAGFSSASWSGFVVDEAGDRVVTVDDGGVVRAFSLATHAWSRVEVPGAKPGARHSVPLALDAEHHRLVLCGGYATDASDLYNDVWSLTLGAEPAWNELVPNARRPSPRSNAGDAYDAARRRLLVFGGESPDLRRFSDVWSLALDAKPEWSRIEPMGTGPSGRVWSATTFDPVRDQLIVFGGYDHTGVGPLADLWTLSFAESGPRWREITPSGTGPGGRNLSPLVHDTKRDRFILMFGSDGSSPLAEIWELGLTRGAEWRQLTPAGRGPRARIGAMVAYDARSDRIIVYGGATHTSVLGDLWVLEFAQRSQGEWKELDAGPSPPARSQGLFETDASARKVFLFGGYDQHLDFVDDLWELALEPRPRWRRLETEGVRPPARFHPNGAYDARSRRLVLTCGGYYNDLWTIALPANTPQLALDDPQSAHDRLWSRWPGERPRGRFDAEPRGSGAIALRFELEATEQVTLELYDLAGRRLARREMGALAAGEHEVSWGDLALAPALYFARLVHGDEARRAKVLVLR